MDVGGRGARARRGRALGAGEGEGGRQGPVVVVEEPP
jgi:hypothetical protein